MAEVHGIQLFFKKNKKNFLPPPLIFFFYPQGHKFYKKKFRGAGFFPPNPKVPFLKPILGLGQNLTGKPFFEILTLY